IDQDRDRQSGKITGLHPDLAGQLVDKSGPGQECDPNGLDARKTGYAQCVSSGATDCLTRTDPDDPEPDPAKKRPLYDRDRNGYPPDCLGWNLTAPVNRTTNILGDDDTTDKLGHGTHCAGTIAAAANGSGVRGVMTKNVAILPVKVVDKAPN